MFGFENGLIFPIYLADQKFENSMDFLLLIDNDKPHYVYIKDFNRFMFHKTKNKNKKYFCKSCLHCFSSKNALTKHKEDCLSINGVQSVHDGSYTKIYQYYIPCNFAYRVVCIDDKFSKPNVVLGVKMLLMNYLKQFLRNTNIVKK